ncbi:MAG: hypothetical protein O2809_01230 [Proteobacteria bacterium]|nr:hypothetical protein [Pseudomonadota bacterium]
MDLNHTIGSYPATVTNVRIISYTLYKYGLLDQSYTDLDFCGDIPDDWSVAPLAMPITFAETMINAPTLALEKPSSRSWARPITDVREHFTSYSHNFS